MDIERLSKNDLEELDNLYQQLLPHESKIPNMREVYDRINDNPNHVVFVAKKDARLLGSLLAVSCDLLFGKCNPLVVVEDVVVDESARGMGVGSALMEKVEEWARERNSSYIILLTETDRPDAIRFYKTLGYTCDGYVGFRKTLESNVK